jgi:iron complex transport system substrate-binding protein
LRDSINSTKKLKPSSIAGKPIDSRWYVPAGNSYVAQILNDAGYTYTFSSIKGTNVESKLVEEVVAISENTDYWFFTHSASSTYNLKSLITELPSATSLSCYKQNKIFMCNSETVDVFGEGIMEPQIILKDLVHASTPFSNYHPKYFKLLK